MLVLLRRLLAAGLICGLACLAGPPVLRAAGEGEIVKAGEKAPETDLPATQIERILPDKKDAPTLNLKDLHGKKNVVLFFFPKALTGG